MIGIATIVAGSVFVCTPITVWDGDGPIWCAEGPRIRLSGIAAREIDGVCKPGHPCPTSSGIIARNQLVKLLGGATGTLRTGHITVKARPMTCRSVGSAGGTRTAAWCTTAGGIDLSCAMVASKHALVWHRYWRQHRC